MLRSIPFQYLFLVWFAFWGCKGTQTSGTSGKQDIPEDFELTFSRTGCKGTCPVFTMYVDAKGEVYYQGEAFVEMEGKYRKSISQDDMRKLVEAVKEAGFFDMNNRYDDPNLMDVPSATIECKMNGNKHKVVDRVEGPEKLKRLEEQIEQIIGKEGFNKLKE